MLSFSFLLSRGASYPSLLYFLMLDAPLKKKYEKEEEHLSSGPNRLAVTSVSFFPFPTANRPHGPEDDRALLWVLRKEIEWRSYVLEVER